MKFISTAIHVYRFTHKSAAITLRSVIARVRFAPVVVRGGRGVRVTGWNCLWIHAAATASLGYECAIDSGSRINLAKPSQRWGIYARRNACKSIATGVGISKSEIAVTESISIGSDMLVGGGCFLGLSNLHALPLTARVSGASPRHPQSQPVQSSSCKLPLAFSIALKLSCNNKGPVSGAASVIAGAIQRGAVIVNHYARAIGTSGEFIMRGVAL